MSTVDIETAGARCRFGILVATVSNKEKSELCSCGMAEGDDGGDDDGDGYSDSGGR